MVFFFYFIIFLFGICIGSFLNSVICRLETGGSFLSGRSHCPNCKHILEWRDLIPLFSFIALRGKCRYCQKKISLQYPLVELATGVLFVLIFGHWDLGFDWSLVIGVWDFFNLFYLLLISSFLLIIFVYDLKHYIIPDKIIYPIIALALIYNLYQLTINNQQLAINNFFAAFGAAAFFFSLVLISRGKWMGIGDVKLAFFMGLFLGFPDTIVALFLAVFSGALIGLILILLGKKTLKSRVPFGPFLVGGTFLSFFWGHFFLDIITL